MKSEAEVVWSWEIDGTAVRRRSALQASPTIQEHSEVLETGGWAILVLPSGLSLSPRITFSATIVVADAQVAQISLAKDVAVDTPIECERADGSCLEVSRQNSYALLEFF